MPAGTDSGESPIRWKMSLSMRDDAKMSRLIWVLFLTLAACQSAPQPRVVDLHPAVVVAQRRLDAQGCYRVQPGDTLYSIALSFDQDYRELIKINNLQKNERIYPKMRLCLHHAPASAAQSQAASDVTALSQRQVERPVKKSTAPLIAGRAPTLRWSWPVHGRIVGDFSGQALGNKGIDILGKRGESVHAAADGRVVYCGSGLVGYGRLIILKHAGAYLSAYAHNDSMLVHEGEVVKRGQVIARLGSSGADRDALHFEIRKAGRPVDPRHFLPAAGCMQPGC